ncbi:MULTISPECIES: YdiY family protein [unclassified Vibrio]|uniref:DUF481 domain-containing protein n=1 Tax=Vibrio sp. HB236076 TaxID=3232307 RepID=A0AB39HFX7_9VIBR|nr:DUF481 domain-containing protein [Vibrio sp. HB161653]MDP5254309.1 DUF481 domain-containing protein [Vibrio sp. HB161653]
MPNLWCFLVLSLLCSPLYAQETPNPNSDASPSSEPKIEISDPLKTEFEIGFQANTGNTDSRTFNTRLSAEYTEGRYRSSGLLKFYNLYEDGDESKRRSNYEFQLDYKTGVRTYRYGSFDGTDSQYTAYYQDYTISAGFGYQLQNTENWRLEWELGPGYRYQKPNLDEIDDDDIVFETTVKEPIVRTQLTSQWQALKSVSLENIVTVIAGGSNTRVENEFNITNKITEGIAVKISHNLTFHNKVPSGLDKTDTTTNVNLLFSF